jgi:putative drug exporter of the RND superfamily
MRSLANYCIRHRRQVVILWIVLLIGMTLLSKVVGTAYSNSFSLPGTESTKAYALIQSVSPKASGDVEHIVIATSDGAKVTDADVQAQVTAMLTRIEQLPHVTEVRSPYSPEGAAQINGDGTVAFATVTFDRLAQSITVPAAQKFVAVAASAQGPNVQVAVGGQVAQQANRVALGGVGLGIIAAGIVLLLVFGSFLAMVMPLASALMSLGTALGLIGILSNVLKMPVFSGELTLLIGLGVGVDYALFIVTRHRQGILEGRDIVDSIVHAVDTSGRAVLFAGVIVCIALLGMFALGVSFLYGLAVAAALGVAFTMLAALTLLPALLGFIGPKILSRKQRKGLAAHGFAPSSIPTKGFWVRWADFVSERPVVPAVVALLVILLLALPFLSLRLGASDQGNDPVGTTTRTAYDLLAKGFGPGFNGPLQLVVKVPDASGESVLSELTSAVADQPGVASVATPVVIPARDGSSIALITVYPDAAPQDSATTKLIDHLRASTIPGAISGSNLTVFVGGTTAIFADFSRVLSEKLPLFIGIVVLLSFLVLCLVFRSLLIPLVSAIMNLLSIAAAFGILVAVFEWGWFGTAFGVNRPGPVEAFLPVMLFAILFGLSMDYQVFLVSRMHEEWLATGDNKTAIRNGLAATGRTITAAAFIMVLVFGSFILGGERVIKEFGLGLAAGVLVDAFIIRVAIVPAVMRLFGRANWWFPDFLERHVPNVGFEHGVEDEEPDGRVEDLVPA